MDLCNKFLIEWQKAKVKRKQKPISQHSSPKQLMNCIRYLCYRLFANWNVIVSKIYTLHNWWWIGIKYYPTTNIKQIRINEIQNNRINPIYPPSQISSNASITISKLSKTARFSTFFFKIMLTESYRQFNTDTKINSFSCVLPIT